MSILVRTKTYSIPEYLTISRLTKSERLAYELERELRREGIVLKTNDKLFNTLAYTLGLMLFIEKRVLAAVPSTGFAPLDDGAWKVVKVFQAAVFWVALLYTLKSLLLLAIRGEGEWKQVATGFFICLGDYLAPWLFAMIPGLFSF